ncbi:S41 family peptidase [Actinocatenispora rupis]|uniref:Interphotoreceptor retinoid-binding protein n=1 Tax=Actinocatenispora rupis TaxID=519421 RepID=A0A8J3JC62_9ACTN|nr:S41 family peptidase [Actinocatenispora rupis]GID15661.1 interphotoreceptor retinoid-binding protein [Actinocatenispora rupis]
MEQHEVTRVVGDLRTLVTERYVFPDVAARVADLLGERAAAGRYDGVADPADLAARVTADVQEANGDKHLRLIAHAEPLADLPGEEAVEAVFAARAERTMGGIARIQRLDGGIGLLEIEPVLWNAELVGDAMTAAMTILARTSGLVIDLRGCVGGDPGVVAYLCTYLLAPETHLNDMIERVPGGGERSTQFRTLPYVPGPRYGTERPIAVLIGPRTFSGGEELAYDLKHTGRATLFGETTAGGAHPRIGIRLHPYLEASVPVARTRNAVTGTNWEGTGVAPDVPVDEADALDAALKYLTG